TLKFFSYGGAGDWTTVGRVRSEKAGQIEFDVHERLSPFSSPQTYFHEGINKRCLEVFSCGYPTARKALIDSLEAMLMGERDLEECKGALVNYNFPDQTTT